MIIEDLYILLGADFVSNYPFLAAVIAAFVVCLLIYSAGSLIRAVFRL